MNRMSVIVVAVLIAVLISAFTLDAGTRRDAIISALGEQTYFSCGFDKLEPAERENLAGLIGSYPTVSYTRSSAEAYMERQGWKPVHVLGAVLVDTVWNEKHLVVMDQYDLYLYDPIAVSSLPSPGIYFGYGTGAARKILYDDGDEGSFWANKLE